LVRVVPTASAGADYFGGAAEIEVVAGNIFQLVDALDRISPGFAEAAGTRLVFAVDGALAEDWTRPLPPDCEIWLVPRIAGG
jgi:molybdopterin converting factor small subunit